MWLIITKRIEQINFYANAARLVELKYLVGWHGHEKWKSLDQSSNRADDVKENKRQNETDLARIGKQLRLIDITSRPCRVLRPVMI